MAEDIESITAPGKYAIDRSFEEVENMLKQGIIISKNSINQLTKLTYSSPKENYTLLKAK
jgi:hypothetical protein